MVAGGKQLVGPEKVLAVCKTNRSTVVVPLRVGAGMRLKIVEALSAECPIVSASIGAEGLGLDSGRELLLGDTPEAFAAAVVQLLADPTRARALGAAGRRTVVARYDWEIIGKNFVDELHEALVRRRGHRSGGP